MDFTVRRVVEDDWQSYRSIRLEMLLDTPIAYGVRYETALEYSESDWRERASGQSTNQLLVAAVDANSGWVGTMGGYLDRDALLEAVEEWARQISSTLRLEVHEDNFRARAAYVKRGFVETGHRRPYDFDPSRDELEMIKQL